jgi:hypothetical protein
MTLILVRCGACGEVELEVSQLTVRVCRDDSSATYNFVCPSCSLPAAKPAGRDVVEVLVAAGADLVFWRLPAEMAEPHAGPPIAEEDVTAFRRLLDTEGWFEQLARMSPD